MSKLRPQSISAGERAILVSKEWTGKMYNAKNVRFDAMLVVLWWYAIVTTIFDEMRSEIFLSDFTAFVDTAWNGIWRSG